MSTYNTKTYIAHGGEELVVGGKLTILEGATVEGLGGALPAPTATTAGVVKAAAKTETDTVPAKIGTDGILYVAGCPQAANQAASTATTVAGLKEEFNTLLASLKTAGLMAADPENPSENDGE